MKESHLSAFDPNDLATLDWYLAQTKIYALEALGGGRTMAELEHCFHTSLECLSSMRQALNAGDCRDAWNDCDGTCKPVCEI